MSSNLGQIGAGLGQIGSQLDSTWTPGDPTGPSWDPTGSRARFGNLASSQVRCLRIRSAFLELTAGTGGEAEMASRTAARSPPPTRAGGQDDGSYTNSLKLEYGYQGWGWRGMGIILINIR